MPVEFRPIDPPTTWQLFPRHPAGADYPDLGAKLAKRMREGIEQYGVMLRPVVLKRERGGLFVLDGWQMYQQCIAVEVRPTFVELVVGIDPADYVGIMNDCRRHESAEEERERIAARRKLAKSLEAKGTANGRGHEKVVEEVAKKLGVSRATVYRDLKADEPPRCERCEREGRAGEDCPACQLLRMDWSPPVRVPTVVKPEEPPQGPTLDANFVVVPEHVLEAFLVAKRIEDVCHKMDADIKELAEILAGKVGSRAISATAAQRLTDVRQHLWQSRAAYVCCYCQGKQEDCTACQGQGWQTRAAFEQSPKDYQDAMRNMGAKNVPI